MFQSLDLPVFTLAVLFLGFTVLFWTRRPLAGRLCLAVATTFALAAAQYPAMGVNDVIAHTQTGLTYLVAAARVLGACTVLVSLTLTLRELMTP
jgi:hypothetical protein